MGNGWIPRDHLMNCRTCGELKYRRFGGRKFCGIGYKWQDQFTKGLWNGRDCPKCAQKKAYKSYGHRSIDSYAGSTAAIGRKYEEYAKNYFESLGAKVTHIKKHGPDMLVDFGMGPLPVEVKKVTGSKGTTDMGVGNVKPSRILDDLICYVFNEDQIFVTSMKNHLLHVYPSGNRRIYANEKNLSGINYNYMRQR